MHFFKQLFTFGYKQALCCIFPIAIFLTLAVTKFLHVPYRYDVILAVCLGVQALLVYTGIETMDELKVISLFHLVGLFLELFKVHHGSWAYPEYSLTKIAGVPVYSGFMYASVASYICQAWRRFDLSFHNWPANKITFTLATAIYLNFFLHHYLFPVYHIQEIIRHFQGQRMEVPHEYYHRLFPDRDVYLVCGKYFYIFRRMAVPQSKKGMANG